MAMVEPRDRASFEDQWAKMLRDERAGLRAVEADGVVVGNVVSWEHEGEREVGYWIGREHWGRGVATTALAAFVAEITERPLFAHVVNTNVGSIRVLEKCGFRRTGTPTVAADGSWSSSIGWTGPTRRAPPSGSASSGVTHRAVPWRAADRQRGASDAPGGALGMLREAERSAPS